MHTDESVFTRSSVHSLYNSHIWATENLHSIRQSSFQQRFIVNFWTGIVNDYIIGPCVIRDRLDGAPYANFLQEMLPVLLEDVHLYVRESMGFERDGASPDFAGRVLDKNSPSKWFWRGGAIFWSAWPPISLFMNMLQGKCSGSRRSN
jgi:hypothetical protein